MASITRQGAPSTVTKAATTAAATSSYGYAEAQANALVAAVNAIIVALADAGIIVAEDAA